MIRPGRAGFAAPLVAAAAAGALLGRGLAAPLSLAGEPGAVHRLLVGSADAPAPGSLAVAGPGRNMRRAEFPAGVAPLDAVVYFAAARRWHDRQAPWLVGVHRLVSPADPAAGVLSALLAGPTAAERSRGLVGVPWAGLQVSGVTVSNGLAAVHLAGSCLVDPAAPVADMLKATLTALPGLTTVWVFDPEGQTELPGYSGDTFPVCLDLTGGRVRYLDQIYNRDP